MRAFADIVRAGKALYIGVSEWTAEQIRAGVELAGELGFHLVSNQPQYSMLWRVVEAEIVPTSRELGVSQVVFSPIAQGALTGKYRPGQPPPAGSRATDEKGGANFIRRFLDDEVLRRGGLGRGLRDGRGLWRGLRCGRRHRRPGLGALGLGPDWRRYRVAVMVTAGWAVTVYLFNVVVGTNYGYLNAKPSAASARNDAPPPSNSAHPARASAVPTACRRVNRSRSSAAESSTIRSGHT